MVAPNYSRLESLNPFRHFRLKPNKVGENKLNDVLQLLEYIGPSEGGDELQSILMNEHFRQLMISHDLISSQIYQSPTLRLYPSGNRQIFKQNLLFIKLSVPTLVNFQSQVLAAQRSAQVQTKSPLLAKCPRIKIITLIMIICIRFASIR